MLRNKRKFALVILLLIPFSACSSNKIEQNNKPNNLSNSSLVSKIKSKVEMNEGTKVQTKMETTPATKINKEIEDPNKITEEDLFYSELYSSVNINDHFDVFHFLQKKDYKKSIIDIPYLQRVVNYDINSKKFNNPIRRETLKLVGVNKKNNENIYSMDERDFNIIAHSFMPKFKWNEPIFGEEREIPDGYSIFKGTGNIKKENGKVLYTKLSYFAPVTISFPYHNKLVKKDGKLYITLGDMKIENDEVLDTHMQLILTKNDLGSTKNVNLKYKVEAFGLNLFDLDEIMGKKKVDRENNKTISTKPIENSKKINYTTSGEPSLDEKAEFERIIKTYETPRKQLSKKNNCLEFYKDRVKIGKYNCIEADIYNVRPDHANRMGTYAIDLRYKKVFMRELIGEWVEMKR